MTAELLKVTIPVPRESKGNTASLVVDFVPLTQFERQVATTSDPNQREYLLLLCGAIRDAVEAKLPPGEIRKEIAVLLEETGYLPKKAA